MFRVERRGFSRLGGGRDRDKGGRAGPEDDAHEGQGIEVERVKGRPRSRAWAVTVAQLKRPSKTGVVRAMAGADHWRRVSAPNWVRTAWNAASTCQRCRNQATIGCGSVALRVGAKQGHGHPDPVWVLQQHPTEGHDGLAGAVLEGRARGALQDLAAPAVPAHGERCPGRVRVGQPLSQRGLVHRRLLPTGGGTGTGGWWRFWTACRAALPAMW